MAGANGGWPAPPTLQLASNLLRSISPTASTIRWMMSSSGSHSIMSTGSRKRCRRSGARKKWAIDPHLGSMAPRESRPPPQRHDLLMPRRHQFAARYGNRLKSARFLLRLLGRRLGQVRVLLDAWFMRGWLIRCTLADGHTVIGRVRRDLALYTLPRAPRRRRPGRPRKYGARLTPARVDALPVHRSTC